MRTAAFVGKVPAHGLAAAATVAAMATGLAFLIAVAVRATPAPLDFQTTIEEAVADGTPGVQAYVKRGHVRWNGVAGLASVESQRAMTETDRLRVASITKMMTYATVMELVKAGRLRLTNRIVELLPAGTLDSIPYSAEITVGQLLDHRSGLHNFNGVSGTDFFTDLFNDPQRGERAWSAADLLAYAKRPVHRPTGPPGLQTAYSSTGYILLQMVLEHREGERFPALFQRYLFRPLGMKSAGVEGADLIADSIAPGYARPAAADRGQPSPFASRAHIRADGLVNVTSGLKYYNAWAQAAGAAAVTALDLGEFMEAVSTDRLTVLANQTAEFSGARRQPAAYFEWNGGSWGIATTVLFQPHGSIVVIVLTNSSNVGPGSQKIAKRLLSIARAAR